MDNGLHVDSDLYIVSTLSTCMATVLERYTYTIWQRVRTFCLTCRITCEDVVVHDRRDTRLAQVKINQADVQVIATEFEVSVKQAEVRLREHEGNATAALESFL